MTRSRVLRFSSVASVMLVVGVNTPLATAQDHPGQAVFAQTARFAMARQAEEISALPSCRLPWKNDSCWASSGKDPDR